MMPDTLNQPPSRPQALWAAHRTRVLQAAVLGLFVIAVIWLSYEFWRMLAEPRQLFGRPILAGAIDLKLRYVEVADWFKGMPVYATYASAAYPPASYVMFYGLFMWPTITLAKMAWLLSTVCALSVLVFVAVRESHAQGRLEKLFVALIPLSLYATGATIGNGQLTIHIMALLVAGFLLLRRAERLGGRELAGALMLLFALVKPSIAVPFFWIVLFHPKRISPAVIILAGYAALTYFSASFQDAGILDLLTSWMKNGASVATEFGQSNICSLLQWLGHEQWILPASLIILVCHGLWVYWKRDADIWTLLAVTAIVARCWTYHAWYDDLLLLFPLIALFRMTKLRQLAKPTQLIAGLLFAVLLLLSIAPGGLYLLPPPFSTVYTSVQVMVWLVILLFLGFYYREPQSRGIPPHF